MAFQLKYTGEELTEGLELLLEATVADEGKVLRIQNGEPVWFALEEAEEVET